MRGLLSIPSPKELASAYAAFQNPSGVPSVREWALWSQWTRFDPRLAEQWVARMQRDWRKVSPEVFRQELVLQPWPQAAGVLLEFCALLLFSEDLKVFRLWQGIALHGLDLDSSGGQFFIGLRAFAAQLMRDDVEWSLHPYLEWGFLGREVLIHGAKPGDWTLLPAEKRRRAILGYLSTHARGSITDLQKASGGWVTRRQLERDLQLLTRQGRVKKKGQTKGALYYKR